MRIFYRALAVGKVPELEMHSSFLAHFEEGVELSVLCLVGIGVELSQMAEYAFYVQGGQLGYPFYLVRRLLGRQESEPVHARVDLDMYLGIDAEVTEYLCLLIRKDVKRDVVFRGNVQKLVRSPAEDKDVPFFVYAASLERLV